MRSPARLWPHESAILRGIVARKDYPERGSPAGMTLQLQAGIQKLAESFNNGQSHTLAGLLRDTPRRHGARRQCRHRPELPGALSFSSLEGDRMRLFRRRTQRLRERRYRTGIETNARVLHAQSPAR